MGSRVGTLYVRIRTGYEDSPHLRGEEGGANRENEVLLLTAVHLPLHTHASLPPAGRCPRKVLRSAPSTRRPAGRAVRWRGESEGWPNLQ
jgi:hypothetical protein